MARNEILDEIYAAREALIAQHGGDVHAYIEAARKRALASGRLVAAPKQRNLVRAPVARRPPHAT